MSLFSKNGSREATEPDEAVYTKPEPPKVRVPISPVMQVPPASSPDAPQPAPAPAPATPAPTPHSQQPAPTPHSTLHTPHSQQPAPTPHPQHPAPTPHSAPASPAPNITQYPDDPHLSEEIKRAINKAKSSKPKTPYIPGALPESGPEPGFNHLAPPKKSVSGIVFKTLLSILLAGAIGLGGWYYWWTNYAIFEYTLQPVVILDGQSVSPGDFLPEGEIRRGVSAVFQDPFFAPVTGPVAVPLTLRYGLRSLDADAALYVLTPETHLTHEFRAEAPDLSPADFITNAAIARNIPFEVAFAEKPLPLSQYEVGEHILRLSLNGVPFEVALTVEDTTPPMATPHDVTIEIGGELTPEDFVSDIYDHSGIASMGFSGDNEGLPYIEAFREQNVEVEISDIYGNTNIFAGKLTVLRNSSPPVFTSVPEVVESMAGRPISYPDDIGATDDFGREIVVAIDDEHVDTSEIGEYTVTFIAEDFTGYRTQAQATLYIIDIDPAEVDAWVDDKLEEIITPDMTQEKKVRAIFDAVRRAVPSTGLQSSEWTGSVYKAAHEAINNSRGNYYNFYALSEIMLTRAGIENTRVVRSENSKAKSEHIWSLVYYDDSGWYHYDSYPVTTWNAVNAIQHKFAKKDITELERQITYATRTEGYYDFDEFRYPDVVQE